MTLPKVLAGIGVAALAASAPAHADNRPLAMASDARCDGLRDLMIDTVVHQTVLGYAGYYNYNRVNYNRSYPRPSRADAKAPVTAPAPAQAGNGGPMEQEPGPTHYTTTNVQERGVDEADFIKTDGRYVYTVHGNELVIAKTWPVAKTEVAARLAFKTITPQALYLHGNDVIVQGLAVQPVEGWQNRTRVMVVDVSDHTLPRIRRIVDVEGYAASSRLVDDELYLVQTTGIALPPKLSEIAQKIAVASPRADQQTLRPWDVQARLANTLHNRLLGAITTADLDAALPKLRNGGTTRHMSCSDLYIPANTLQLQVTSLARVSLGSDRADMIGALIAGGTVYASTSALFVAAPQYSFDPQTGAATYGTQIHEFSLGDRETRPAYVASGHVEGQILNELAMSEHKGDLRIATTDWMWNGGQGGNNLFVLRPQGRELRQIGAVRGIAKGERIFAGRMIGDKGYLVTFRQTDPLFTLDLRDPKNPRVVGELKVNGFSSYIHPIGGDQLLTIGQDADAAGRVNGLHLQVFDVRDPANPVRRFHEDVTVPAGYAYSYSQAQNDRHAFLFDPISGTIAFPVSEQNGNKYFNGLVVYKLDKRGFHLKGRLAHERLSDLQFELNCEQYRKTNPQYAPQYCGSEQTRKQSRMSYPVSRSMVVDKYILSFSPLGMEVHELANLDLAATLSWVQVEKRQQTWIGQ